MSNIFKNVSTPKLPYNNFPLGFENLLSGQIGKLIPIQCDEVTPGDRFNQSIGFLLRFAPLSAPVMARFNVHFHSFYVPNRIITPETSRESTWERFVKSIGKDETEVPDLPYIVADVNAPRTTYEQWLELAGDGGVAFPADFETGSLWDYMDLTPIDRNLEPLKSSPDRYLVHIPYENRLLALPFFAYQYIYNDFYRRDQIEKEIPMPVNVGKIDLFDYSSFVEDVTFGNTETYTEDDERYWKFKDPDLAKFYDELFKLRTRNYERDYFTSALPEPQFGDDVLLNSGELSWIGQDSTFGLQIPLGATNLATLYSLAGAGSMQDAAFSALDAQNGYLPLLNTSPDNKTTYLSADLSSVRFTNAENFASNFNVGSISVNDFRIAIQLQGIREAINRGGTRYLEIMQSIYGVTVPDARLQRPVYLGGCKNPVDIGTVVQTSETKDTPQGTLTGKMQAVGGYHMFSTGYEFKEHGYLVTIMSVTPRTSYYGGTPRKFLKHYPEDFFLPQFDHLGEQEIQKRELFDRHFYEDAPDVADKVAEIRETFGYTPRYAELKSGKSSVHGEFRTSLDNWHVARDFDSLPSLSPDFIKAEPEDFSRIFEFENIENTSNEHFYAQVYIDVVGKRRMSKYSTPWTLY